MLCSLSVRAEVFEDFADAPFRNPSSDGDGEEEEEASGEGEEEDKEVAISEGEEDDVEVIGEGEDDSVAFGFFEGGREGTGGGSGEGTGGGEGVDDEEALLQRYNGKKHRLFEVEKHSKDQA